MDFKVGEEVVICSSSGWSGPSYRRDTVKAITPSGKIKLVQNPDLWTKHGKKVGGDKWHCPWLEPFDQGKWDRVDAEQKQRRDRRLVSEIDWRTQPIEKVRAVLALIGGQSTRGKVGEK